jgi:TRAP-type C4-dicarboxylate transport system substrate-binding protein
MALPFLGVPNTAAAFDIYNQMVTEFPEIREEFINAGLIPLAPFYAGRLDLYMSVEANVRTPSDLSGRRVLVTGPYEAAVLGAAGAAPVLTTMADIYQSLSGGIAEGIINHSSLIFAAGSQELIETVVLFGEPGASPGMGKYIFQFVMNPRTFNNLPADLQVLVQETLWELGRELTAVEEQNHQGHMGFYRGRGVDIIVLTEAEIAAFAQTVATIHTDNVAIAARRVPNAQAIFDRLLELARQHS